MIIASPGRELKVAVKQGVGLFCGLNALIGAEFFANNGYISQSTSAYVLNPAFQPQFLAGIYAKRVDVYLGIIYNHIISTTTAIS